MTAKEAKLDGPKRQSIERILKHDPIKSGRPLVKPDGHCHQSGRYRMKVVGLLSQTGRPWVKVDENLTLAHGPRGKVDGPEMRKQTVQITVHYAVR